MMRRVWVAMVTAIILSVVAVAAWAAAVWAEYQEKAGKR